MILKHFKFFSYTLLYVPLVTNHLDEGSLKKKKEKTAIIMTLSLSHFKPTLRKDIGTVNIGAISMKSDHPPSPLRYKLKIDSQISTLWHLIF